MKALLVAVMLMFATPTLAAELLMIHSPTCVFCQAFMKDTRPGYSESEQAKTYPLRIIDISLFMNREWLRQQTRDGAIKPIRGTPTFIVWDDNREMGRIVGYSGSELWYRRLDNIISNLNLYLFNHP